jgi:hypothetical protein
VHNVEVQLDVILLSLHSLPESSITLYPRDIFFYSNCVRHKHSVQH